MACNCGRCDNCLPFRQRHMTILDRPDVHCSFHVMDQCNSIFSDGKLADACREGARDAHLLSTQFQNYGTLDEQQAYEAGKNTTLLDCTPVLFQ